MSSRPEFVVKLRAPADPTDPGGIRRLRAALKRLGRGYGLRCVAITPAIDPPPPDAQASVAPPAPGAQGGRGHRPAPVPVGHEPTKGPR